MARRNKKNSLVRKFLNKFTPVGVIKQARGLKKDLRARDSSITELAQSRFKKKYGKRIRQSVIKANLESGLLSKEVKDYLKIKKKAKKEVT